MIVIASNIQTNAIRVDSNIQPATRPVSESVDPKAEALTLVIHNFPMNKFLPVKLNDRNDDVVVIHSNRLKRKPTSRNRRPSSQFRSKIKHPGSASSFGGFKDSSSDYHFPPFPTKNFAEPQRASNKFKNGPKPNEGYSYNPPSKKRPKKKPPIYGPPPTLNQFESSYDSQTYDSPSSPSNGQSYDIPSPPSNGQRLQTLQSIQQHQTHFPTFSIDAADPTANFYSASNDQFPQPINNFPLEQAPTYNSHKTSYGNPVHGNPSNFNFNPNILGTTLNSNLNANLGSQSSSYSNFNQKVRSPEPIQNQNKKNHQNQNQNSNSNSNFPSLPSRYEPKEFSTPTRQNPLTGNGNQFWNEYNGSNDGSESQNVPSTANPNKNHNRENKISSFNKFNNFDYDFTGQKNSPPEEEEDDGSYDYVYTTRRATTTTTTEEPEPSTKRPKKSVFGKRKRPARIPQTHTLDTDDLRDAFTESSDFHEISLNSDDFINFDSQRHNKRNQQQNLHEIHSTLKTARNQNSALRSVLGDDFEIVSVQKSLEKDPNEEDPFGFQRKQDQGFDSDISFAPLAATPVMWNGDVGNFPRNHRFL